MNMANENISLWRHIVSNIHPDRNPNITNPGEKMAKVMDNKNNEAYLKLLARQWNIVLPREFQPKEEDIKRFFYYGKNALYVGNFVEILLNKKDQNRVAMMGYIVDKKEEKNGYKVYICDTYDTIRVIFILNENIDIVRERKDNINMYDDVRKANEVYKKYKEEKKKKEQKDKVKNDYQKYKDLFARYGLKMNTDYNGMGVKIKHNGVWYKVVKTTTRKVKLSYLNINVEIKIEDITK